MNDLLKEIMCHEQELNRISYDTLPEFRDLVLPFEKNMDEIFVKLGQSFYENLLEQIDKRTYISQLAYFTHGFRVAVRLLLT